MLRVFFLSLFIIGLVACSFNYDNFSSKNYLEVRYQVENYNKYYFRFDLTNTTNSNKRFIVLDKNKLYKIPLDITKKENFVNILFIDEEYNLNCNSSLEDKKNNLKLYYNCR